MQVLVTGAQGFAGQHLITELLQAGHTPYGFDLQPSAILPESRFFTGDLCDPEGMLQLIRTIQPDACIHLGGIAFVPVGWSDPQLVFSVNLIGTVNLLEAIRSVSPATRTLIVSSAEVYGREPCNELLPEDTPLAPANPYAASKMGADLTALLYARRYDMPIMTARPANHIGPRQSTSFVASSFAHQLAQIALQDKPPLMTVGNLDSERDFTDVRDIVHAYRLIIEKGQAGTAYNISSETPVTIRTILDQLCRIAGITPDIKVDQARWRPADSLPLLGTQRLRSHTHWAPRISLAQTLQDIYQDITAQLQAEHDIP